MAKFDGTTEAAIIYPLARLLDTILLAPSSLSELKIKFRNDFLNLVPIVGRASFDAQITIRTNIKKVLFVFEDSMGMGRGRHNVSREEVRRAFPLLRANKKFEVR